MKIITLWCRWWKREIRGVPALSAVAPLTVQWLHQMCDHPPWLPESTPRAKMRPIPPNITSFFCGSTGQVLVWGLEYCLCGWGHLWEMRWWCRSWGSLSMKLAGPTVFSQLSEVSPFRFFFLKVDLTWFRLVVFASKIGTCNHYVVMVADAKPCGAACR